MTAFRIGIYAREDVTFIAWVPRYRNARWLDEVNTPGTGQFELRIDDAIFALHPDLLDDFNVVKYFVDGQVIKAWRIENTVPIRVQGGDGADRWVTVSGRGPAADLEAAVVFPEYGLRELVSEDRWFNFASAEGAWYVSADWDTPVGVRWKDDDTSARAGFPKNWPDRNAQWLWSSDPTLPSTPGRNWFRSTITLTENTPVIIYATADNSFKAYMDGVQVLSSGRSDKSGWRDTFAWRMTLAQGDHVFAAVAKNFGGLATGTNDNPAGFIASIYKTDAAGNRTDENIYRSKPGNTLVKAYGDQPGWNGAAILQQLVLEAQDRNVTDLMAITFDFDNTVDSAGETWDDIQNRLVKVATTDYADLATQVIELSLDMDIDADFVMHCWKKRGEDKTATIRIMPGRDVTAAVGNRQAGRVRNHALLKYDGGWMQLYSAESKDLYGRREVGLSLGNSGSDDQTELTGTAALREVVQPEQTIPLSYTSLKGPQPYVDYGLGDVIVVPDFYANMTNARLMSVAATVNEGFIQWDLDFYPETADDTINTMTVATGGSYDDISTLYKHEVLSDSPWGYWRLQENSGTTFADISGHKYDMSMAWPGTTANKPALSQPGPVSEAAGFGTATGTTSDSFSMAHAHTSVPTKKLFNFKYATFEVWIKRTDNPSDKESIMLMYTDTYVAQWDLGIGSAGRAYFSFTDTDDNVHTLTSTDILPSGSFTHVVGSMGPTGQKLYINGELDQHVTASLGTAKHAGYDFGLRADLGGDVSNVVIAEPVVYFQQLTNSRILSHFRTAAYTP